MAEGEQVKRTKVLWIALACVLVVVHAAYLFGTVEFKNFRIASDSMQQTLMKNDHVVVMRTKNIRRGDLVAYRLQSYGVVKRAVAFAGEIVEIRDKRLSVNGKEIAEPYAIHEDAQIYPREAVLPEPYHSRDQFGPLTIPPGMLFVLGDNRDHSNDSRYHGPIVMNDVVGRVVLIYSSRGFRRPPTFSRSAPAPQPK